MANLAIKGHPTRGKEVIEILEMLGGKNKYLHFGESESYAFYIIDGIIDCDEVRYLNDYIIYTLEEFLEKFPYKVGDKVKCARINDFIGRIINVRWDDNENQIIYVVEWDDITKSTLTYFANGLQPYKEETMDKVNKAVFDANAQCCDIMNRLIKEETMEEIIKIDIPKGYEFAGVDDDNQQVVFEKIDCKYPKTYEECCRILDNHPNIDYVEGYKWKLMMSFQKLLICRDAYLKIAGEQMGLNEPWKPDWINGIYTCTIICRSNKVVKDGGFDADNRILAFLTEEMRDAFYENFKDLIEYCKELL